MFDLETAISTTIRYVVLALVIAAGLFFGMEWQRHECGMCGASTFEYYYIMGADATPCEVCEHCYLLCFE